MSGRTLALRYCARAALLGASFAAVAPTAHARDAVPPAVTVVAFDGATSADAGKAMADELAMRLVETRRFRVLPREWLPLPAGPAKPALGTLRSAALGAGVDTLVMGSVSEAAGSRPLARSAPASPALLARGSGSWAMPRGAGAIVSVHVRVVDVVTGAVVRTAVASQGAGGRVPPPVYLPGLLILPAGAPARPVVLPPAVAQRAIAEIAQTLNLSPAGSIPPDR